MEYFDCGSRREIRTENAAYIIKRIEQNAETRVQSLTDGGYSFHDRLFFMEIPASPATPARKAMPPRLAQFRVIHDREYSGEVYALAEQAVPTDRRFHLEREYDQAFTFQAIRAYIDFWREQGAFFLKIHAAGELLGYTLVRKNNRDDYENLLGVTKPGLRGKAIASSLYAGLLDYIWEQSGKQYIGRVSTLNLPSINLHLRLGARIKYVYDEYLLKTQTK